MSKLLEIGSHLTPRISIPIMVYVSDYMDSGIILDAPVADSDCKNSPPCSITEEGRGLSSHRNLHMLG